MIDSWYDTAIICGNGHVLNAASTTYPALSPAFCERCGAEAVAHCPWCGAPIRGEFHPSGTLTLDAYVVPAYCASCGTAYPWTERRLQAAAELADEMEHLSPRERILLKESIVAVACDGPASPVAVVRLRRLLATVGAGAAESFRQILVGVVSEAVRKALWG